MLGKARPQPQVSLQLSAVSQRWAWACGARFMTSTRRFSAENGSILFFGRCCQSRPREYSLEAAENCPPYIA